MNLVALETSDRDGSVAALEAGPAGEVRRWETPLPARERSAKTLPAALRELLARAGWRAEHVDAVAVASGPGSFTGLRVGVTAAKMLAYVAGAPVVEVNTLAVVAAQAKAADEATRSPECAVWAAIDAQRGELFTARWDAREEVGPDACVELLSVDAWLERLAPGDLVTGPVVGRLVNRLPSGVTAADPALWSPRAVTVAELALPRALAGETIGPERLVPRYYRRSAAEEKLG